MLCSFFFLLRERGVPVSLTEFLMLLEALDARAIGGGVDEFYVYETRQWIKARHRPIIIITSNNEKELPDAFLRRCFFHYIRFPDLETMQKIVAVHYPDLKKELLSEALNAFFKLRDAQIGRAHV